MRRYEKKVKYANEVLENLKKFGYDPCVMETKKNNGVLSVGVALKREGSSTAPIVYITDEMLSAPAEEIASSINEKLSELSDERAYIEKYSDLIADADYCLARIVPMVVNYDKNKNELGKRPYRILAGDLALQYGVVVGGEDEEAIGTMVITNQVLALWNLTEEDLYEKVVKNGANMLGCRILPISEVLKERGVFLPLQVPLYVTTNFSCLYGAGLLACPQAMPEEDSYIIPSSVHEYLSIPLSAGGRKEDLAQLVREVNRKDVLDEYFLSNKLYVYRVGEGLSLA